MLSSCTHAHSHTHTQAQVGSLPGNSLALGRVEAADHNTSGRARGVGESEVDDADLWQRQRQRAHGLQL